MVKEDKGKTKKVFIIGLDGGTWKILRPLMDQGKMPNLKKLVEQGASGTLKSTIPPVTAPAWTSFQTGVNPGKHGIFDFQTFNPKTKQSTIVDSRTIPIKTLWDFASSYGKKVVTINVPLTYPPKEDRNRITIGGMLSPKVDTSLIYPKKLFDSIIRKTGYQITGGPLERRISMKLEKFVEQEIKVERTRCKVARCLMSQYDWDLLMLHIQSSDGIQHCFYPYLDPNCSNFDPEKYQVLTKFYRIIDQEIGNLVESLGNTVTLVILSDHGFRELKKTINLNAWLREQGLLHLSGVNILGKVMELVRKYDRYHIKERIAAKLLESFLSLREIAIRMNNQVIDWERTQAFMPNGTIFGGVFFDEKTGVEALEKHILVKLRKLRDPKTSNKVIKQIHPKAEVFHGPYIHLIPNLLIEPQEGYAFGVPLLAERGIFRTMKYPYDKIGTHDLKGIVIFNGTSVEKSVEVDAHIIDLAPTILALLGIEIPAYMDGKVLKEVFSEELEVVKKTDKLQKPKGAQGMSSEEKEEVEKRLRDLGYL